MFGIMCVEKENGHEKIHIVPALAGKPVRFRSCLHGGTPYSFWVSPSPKGESRGYVAGGGPAYPGLRDMSGK